MDNNWLNFNLSKPSDFHLPSITEEQTFDFDTNDFLDFANTDAGLHEGAALFTDASDLKRHLIDISSRLDRIEQNMARKEHVDQLRTRVEGGLQSLYLVVTDVKRGLERLKSGLECYTKGFLENFLPGNGQEENIE